jgi:hypothetical protein
MVSLPIRGDRMELWLTTTNRLHNYGLWRMLAWGEAGLALIDGAIYFVKGNSYAAGPSYYVLKHMPWGLHSYGAVMLVLALYVVYSSAKRGALARRVQFAVFVFAVWISVAIVVSWYISQAVSFGALTKWFFIAWVAISLHLTESRERRIVVSAEEE